MGVKVRVGPDPRHPHPQGPFPRVQEYTQVRPCVGQRRGALSGESVSGDPGDLLGGFWAINTSPLVLKSGFRLKSLLPGLRVQGHKS